MIGILTFHRGPNYGGFLQAWHLREAVRSLGHEAHIVNYQGLRHHEAERQRFRGVGPRQVKAMLLHYLKFRPFRDRVESLSHGPFLTNPAAIRWNSYEAIVVGSDIVWDFLNPSSGADGTYFGALDCQANTRFVAYAPSCGETPADAEIPDFVRRGLRRFTAIHVRDRNTAAMVRHAIGIEPPLVVDPTWLQDDPVLSCRKVPAGLRYALVYGQGATGARARQIGNYCRMRGLSLVSAAFPCEATTHRLYSIDPFEWVDLFRRAEGVVTSTFHGLLYAIKYRKPVVFMVRGPSRSKSQIVIDRCGLHDRVVEEGAPFDPEHLAHCLSQSDGCEIPENWRLESMELLRKALEE